ncbi:unnamed protein product [Cylindrotheca closterium]|uniref:Uncharacterized protein n=1 Tax=Cylindrotheca closterium TaxID=2856 RepID=A0AAD2CEW3_9STRA|nr:unnamed protein product [Cylindrotheca closterium]
MLTKVFIPKYWNKGKGKSLLQFFYIPAVKKPPPAHPEQSATQDAKTPDSPLPPVVSSTPPEPTPANSISNQPSYGAFSSAKLSASEQPLVTESFDCSAWLAAMDVELNQGPAGLFQIILPGPIDGFYVFVVRQKFASLAQEVLKNLAAFLISHLELWQDLKHQRKTCHIWLCLDHSNQTVTNTMTWDQSQHHAISEYGRDIDQMEKDDIEWIEKLLAAVQASLEFE